MSISDDEWVAAARARAARGQWEREPDVVLAALRGAAAERAAAEPPLPACPYCQEHPRLQRFQRYELQTVRPLLYCPACYGFWAVGDALVRGVADPGVVHPALETGLAPRRCRACFGHLKPDNTCAKCGQELPRLACPQCGLEMERYEKEGVLLDQCGPCTGTWFDVGEVAAVFKLAPPQGLAASTVDEHAADDEPTGWLVALSVVSRLVFPYLRF